MLLKVVDKSQVDATEHKIKFDVRHVLTRRSMTGKSRHFICMFLYFTLNTLKLLFLLLFSLLFGLASKHAAEEALFLVLLLELFLSHVGVGLVSDHLGGPVLQV